MKLIRTQTGGIVNMDHVAYIDWREENPDSQIIFARIALSCEEVRIVNARRGYRTRIMEAIADPYLPVIDIVEVEARIHASFTHSAGAPRTIGDRVPKSKDSDLLSALETLVRQIEISGAVDDHGHPLTNLQALEDARALIKRVKGIAAESEAAHV